MSKIEVDAYDCRHPEHEKFLEFQCDTGLDITLHPRFIVEIEVADAAHLSLSHGSNGGLSGHNPGQQSQVVETGLLAAGADQPPPEIRF